MLSGRKAQMICARERLALLKYRDSSAREGVRSLSAGGRTDKWE